MADVAAAVLRSAMLGRRPAHRPPEIQVVAALLEAHRAEAHRAEAHWAASAGGAEYKAAAAACRSTLVATGE